MKGPARGPGSPTITDWPEGPPHPISQPAGCSTPWLCWGQPKPAEDSPSAVRRSGKRPEVYGLAEVADLVGYDQRNKDRLRRLMPEPDVQLSMGPLWFGDTIRAWLRESDIVR